MSALHHAVNGFFDVFKSKPAPAAQSASRAARVKVESRYNEDDEESLLESANSLPRQTLKALEKQLRTDGFKGALVSGWNQGDRGGFTVHYGGEKYEFEISESVTPRPMGEIGRLVKESGRYDRNGRGIYHGTAAGKNDMVLHQDHRGAWRIDLVTSSGGNHTDVTGPNRGYGSAEEAFQAALDVQRTRGIRGKSHVFIADRDGNLSDYEPMEANVSSTMRVFRGDETNQVHGTTGNRALPDHWYYEPEDYDGDTLWSWGFATKAQAEKAAGLAETTPVYTGGMGYQGNGRTTTVDAVAARELDLYIANTYELVAAPNSIGKSIDTNLKRKIANGSYDSALAPKAWQHLVDEGAKRYQREFGSDSPIFSAATRRQVAADFARAWEEENRLTENGKKTIRFVRAGQVERWQASRRSYVWHDGYSEDGNIQPWLTRREAQASAKERGARAVFEG